MLPVISWANLNRKGHEKEEFDSGSEHCCSIRIKITEDDLIAWQRNWWDFAVRDEEEGVSQMNDAENQNSDQISTKGATALIDVPLVDYIPFPGCWLQEEEGSVKTIFRQLFSGRTETRQTCSFTQKESNALLSVESTLVGRSLPWSSQNELKESRWDLSNKQRRNLQWQTPQRIDKRPSCSACTVSLVLVEKGIVYIFSKPCIWQRGSTMLIFGAERYSNRLCKESCGSRLNFDRVWPSSQGFSSGIKIPQTHKQVPSHAWKRVGQMVHVINLFRAWTGGRINFKRFLVLHVLSQTLPVCRVVSLHSHKIFTQMCTLDASSKTRTWWSLINVNCSKKANGLRRWGLQWTSAGE